MSRCLVSIRADNGSKSFVWLGKVCIGEDVFLIECSIGCWEEFVGIHLMFVYICIYRLFLGETGEAFSEECPNNNRDRKTLEEIILK